MDKVKFGLKNVHIFPIKTVSKDGVPEFDEGFAVPGAVNLSLNKDGDTKPFFADNIKYYVTVSNNGYEGDLEIAVIPDTFRIKILKYEKDNNGVLIEDSSKEPTPFAMTYEEDGDQTGTKFCLYNGTATRPSLTHATTQETKDPSTQKLNMSFAPLKNGRVLAMTTGDTDKEVVEKWHNEPYWAENIPSA
ncbi:MAG: phage tail protein [Lachnospiraceae bacterium]|nr:phage tail protein [Lachnospiraceae bacterium]